MRLNARSAAVLAGVNRNTATLYFHKLREEIASRLEQETPELMGGETDESYFGEVHKGKKRAWSWWENTRVGIVKTQWKSLSFSYTKCPC